ncbi:MAG: orotate phosphoribosyltransferase [Candidatus Bathyarchaeia archaeon]
MSSKVYEIAGALVRSGCLKFGAFRLKSGIVSPYYIDLTWLLSSPRDLCCIADATAQEIGKIMASNKIDKLASIELKGALLLPSIACRLNLPCLVVRKEEKRYGVTGRVVGGEVVKGERLLFFDDVITDGKSKLEGIKPLERLGAQIEIVTVVVDREQGGKENLERLGYRLRSLTTISELVKHLFQSSHISKEQFDATLDYVKGS